MTLLELLIGTNSIAIIFAAGTVYQKVKYLDRRVERIEKLLNGMLTKN